jgi:MarR family 2-MHQ and catechol resistance regulon transcriptional repressor
MENDELSHIPPEAANDLDVLLTFGLMRTNAYILPYLDRGLKDLKVTVVQLNALLLLFTAGTEGLKLSELGSRLVVTKANVTGLVDRLVLRGLVFRDTEADRRVTVAKLTEEGRSMVTNIFPNHTRIFSVIGGGLTLAEKKQLTRLLYRLRLHFRESGIYVRETQSHECKAQPPEQPV